LTMLVEARIGNAMPPKCKPTTSVGRMRQQEWQPKGWPGSGYLPDGKLEIAR
ncbi:hypothetical protein Ancab_001788, partial [Ancistrocladus abbreviatus]